MNIEARLNNVREEYLRRMTQGHSRLLRQVEEYTTSRNGKMLRPRILLAAAATLGDTYLASERTLLLAVCVEMLHNTSLLHDDVIDRSDSRRGLPSVNAHWNNAIAILVGDYHLTQIMQLLDEVNDRDVTRRVNETVKSMVEAELLQQEQLSAAPAQHAMDIDTYRSIIDGKTANLFALAATLGNPDYRDFGLHYGRIFQLRDDIADGEAAPFTMQLLEEEEATIKSLPYVLNI